MSGIKEGTLPQGLLPMATDGVASSASELVLHSPKMLKASPRPNGLRPMKAQGIALGFDSRIAVKAPTGRPYSMRIVHSI
jgi:hypothetical protein